MASTSVLLLPLERLSPCGSFNVLDDSSLRRCSRIRRRGTRMHWSIICRTSLESGVLSSTTLEGVYTGARNGYRSTRLGIVCYGSRGKGGSEHERAKLGNVTRQMRLLLESEGLLASEAAHSLVNSMSPDGRSALISALFPATEQSVDYFEKADANSDGIVDAAEFANFVETQAHFYENSNKPLTKAQLYHLATRAAIGMVGFGFTDNAIMILAGDVIQNTIGLTLGLSTLMSAGLGNAVADLIGTAFRGYIDGISGKFMPEVKISSRQLESKECWWAETVGASAGVTLGCLLGLAPLFFLHQKNATATPTVVIAEAGNDVGGIPSQSQKAVEFRSRSAGAGNSGETAFATISAVAAPCNTHRPEMAQKLGGSVFILMVTVAMAVKRVQKFINSRKKFE
ncbi:hypothetical protein M758_4G227600 [Ceratodon purpureus]|uniref:EF-hand domain-containing protein n=1 Tax=Ceratodon purpureus TaxID=3225 RepID=A0A8T0IF01_CERPU|nr:hypothetical protein KC19_4G223100 [Ceratodon purpureus]KAG0620584.1 hypothetical protein M758_4G227600 [Ceratodon purpureus]